MSNLSQNTQNNAKLQYEQMRLGNRLAAGKQPVGALPITQKKGFVGFVGFVTKQKRIKQQINKIKVKPLNT